uniref:NADH-ubiquinone oxidoreductase chain 2 n=1 Tax=Hackeriella veitchi TaxID=60873 RepID=L7N6K3_9HEMI|nr:NADH dehydrogenase subunit 2 [Hackeriella veitchi]ACV96700.1 NADH dehydrogenase subunit 2 [Hackeriella veitchi]
MKLNSSYILFLLVLVSSLVLISGSTSWLGIWVGLEMNFLSFLPLLTSSENFSKSSSSLKYFMVQSLGTILLLISIILILWSSPKTMELQNLSLTMSLLLKLGSSPFHLWTPSIMENLSWFSCFIMLTMQKLGPLIALSNLMKMKLMIWIILMNLMVGTLGSLNQNSLRKLMGYSSITHTGWILTGMIEGINCWMFYFIIYSILNLTLILTFYFMNVSFINQWTSIFMKPSQKLWMISCFLSMSGFPPMIGFYPKWLILENTMITNSHLITSILILSSLISLFIYLRISFSLLLIYSSSMKMNMWKSYPMNNLISIGWVQVILMIVLPVMM